jgi:hypothetical protein
MLKKVSVVKEVCNDVINVDVVPEEEEKDIVIPKSHVGVRTDLKKLKGFNDKRKERKYLKFQSDYVKSVMLEIGFLQDSDDRKYDASTILFIMQSVEDEFTFERKLGAMKRDTVHQICGKYFIDDERLIDTFIEMSFKNLKQSRLLRRLRLRVYDFFLIIVNLRFVLPSI